MDINILLFDDFETLDVFGPVEVLGHIKEYNIKYYSEDGGIIRSAQNLKLNTEAISNADRKGILVIPGGRGTRSLVNDPSFLNILYKYAAEATYCLSICTGSALLGKCNVLDGKKATSNKKAMDWVKSVSNKVNWVDKARWVVDDKYYTSSGVSAGIDMALGFISDRYGRRSAEEIADSIEYVWNDDCTNDKFVV